MLSIGSVMLSIVGFILAMGPLIAFHEFGHFWVARRCGVKVLRYSIGFGKPIWMKKSGADQVEYVLSAIPLGGYVKMLDEREGDVAPEEAHRAFNRQSLAKRSAIVAAGPIFNLILAVLIYFVLYLVGIPGLKPIIGEVTPDSVAAKAGFKPGDQIMSVAGEQTITINSARLRIIESALDKEPFSVTVKDSSQSTHRLTLDLSGFNADELQARTLHLIGLKPEMPPVIIGDLDPEGAGARDGLRKGDHILKVNDEPIKDFYQWLTIIQKSANVPLQVELERDGSVQTVQLTPESVTEKDKTMGKIKAGVITPKAYIEKMSATEQFTVGESLFNAFAKTWQISTLTLKMIGKMITGEVSLKNLSGPFTIADYAGQTMSMGMLSYLTFIALISISLGVLNLLPIPILDGGHLFSYALEFIKGSPLSEAVQLRMQKVGMLMLGLLMMLAIYNDIYYRLL